MVLDRKRVACPLRVGGEVLPQVEEFKYLGVLFTSEGKMEREIDRRIGAASAVMRSVYRTVVVKKELSRKAKLSIYRSIYVPTLTYGHELWVMTEKGQDRWIQAAEMSFLRRVAGCSLRDRVRSSVTREELGVEPLLLHIERSQLRWLGHLFRMPPGRLPREVFQACPTGRRPRGRPRTRWRDYASRLAWERLGVPPEELEEVSGVRIKRKTMISIYVIFTALATTALANITPQFKTPLLKPAVSQMCLSAEQMNISCSSEGDGVEFILTLDGHLLIKTRGHSQSETNWTANMQSPAGSTIKQDKLSNSIITISLHGQMTGNVVCQVWNKFSRNETAFQLKSCKDFSPLPIVIVAVMAVLIAPVLLVPLCLGIRNLCNKPKPTAVNAEDSKETPEIGKTMTAMYMIFATLATAALAKDFSYFPFVTVVMMAGLTTLILLMALCLDIINLCAKPRPTAVNAVSNYHLSHVTTAVIASLATLLLILAVFLGLKLLMKKLRTMTANRGSTECDLSELRGDQQCFGALWEPLIFHLPTNEPNISLKRNNKTTILKTTEKKVVILHDEYKNKSSYFTNGTFKLNKAQKRDSGDYLLETYTSNGTLVHKINIHLKIQAPVSKPTVSQTCLSPEQMKVSCSSEGDELEFILSLDSQLHTQIRDRSQTPSSWTTDTPPLAGRGDKQRKPGVSSVAISLHGQLMGNFTCNVRNNASREESVIHLKSCKGTCISHFSLVIVAVIASVATLLLVLALFLGVKHLNKKTRPTTIHEDNAEDEIVYSDVRVMNHTRNTGSNSHQNVQTTKKTMTAMYMIFATLATAALAKGPIECNFCEHTKAWCSGAVGQLLLFHLPSTANTEIKLIKDDKHMILKIVKNQKITSA
ncbi:hypothetical protein L3Q82_022440 [Scortum barcoo]|uniref:Uncharacterized protein n=1 Tax=Scortum barcoo TaxID=214431 RepID=A0ACB8X1B0_9TELE|nr:hypothetical protein L3Q82_022440 [Scortum barcoo]